MVVRGPMPQREAGAPALADLGEKLLQNRMASDIAEQFRVTLNRQEQAALARSKVVNPEIYEAYLKVRTS
jgi:hypothetical protein